MKSKIIFFYDLLTSIIKGLTYRLAVPKDVRFMRYTLEMDRLSKLIHLTPTLDLSGPSIYAIHSATLMLYEYLRITGEVNFIQMRQYAKSRGKFNEKYKSYSDILKIMLKYNFNYEVCYWESEFHLRYTELKVMRVKRFLNGIKHLIFNY